MRTLRCFDCRIFRTSKAHNGRIYLYNISTSTSSIILWSMSCLLSTSVTTLLRQFRSLPRYSVVFFRPCDVQHPLSLFPVTLQQFYLFFLIALQYHYLFPSIISERCGSIPLDTDNHVNVKSSNAWVKPPLKSFTLGHLLSMSFFSNEEPGLYSIS